MNWVSALSPWQWAVMLSVPPLVVLLYFLKLRRSPQIIPSTYLWRKAIEDLQVNSFWQRLRRNLLLLLQLLFLLAIILACLRPGYQTTSAIGERVIFLLDNSASMQANDLEPTRFKVAKDRIRDEIEGMEGNQAGMLITFSNRADVLQGFTAEKSRLLRALDQATVTNRESDISEAIRTAVGLSNLANVQTTTADANALIVPANIRIFSDGRFTGLGGVEFGNVRPEYIAVGMPKSENVAVVAFSLSRNIEDAEAVQAFARVRNFSGTPKKVTLSLKMEDQLLDASEVTIPANETSGVSFDLDNPPASVQYTVSIAQDDALQVDNMATATLRPSRQIEVLVVSEGSQALQKVFDTQVIKEFAAVTFVEPTDYKNWATGGFGISVDSSSPFSQSYDLVLFDNVEVESLPPTSTFFFGGSIPTTSGWTYGPVESPLIIADWDRSHPIMQFVTLANVQVMQGRSLKPPDGATIVMRTGSGPIFSIARRGAYQDAVLGFSLREMVEDKMYTNTNWPIRNSFPVFMLSMLENVGGLASQRNVLNVKPGDIARLSVPARMDQCTVTMPNGRIQVVDQDTAGQISVTNTDQLGLYQVSSKQAPDVPLDAFVVNLLSNEESQISTLQQLQLSGQGEIMAEGNTTIRREYWRWLLMIGFILLFVEWTVYTRRILV